MISCPAQISCKIDRRINLDIRLSRYRRQQPGREMVGSNLHLYRPMKGIRSLGSQHGIAGLQGKFMNLYGIVFVLDINTGRFYSCIINISLGQSPGQTCPGIIGCPIDSQLPFQTPLYGLQGCSRQFQDTAQIRSLHAGPRHNPAIRRIIPATQFISPSVLFKMKIGQPENTAVTTEVALYISEGYAIKGQ